MRRRPRRFWPSETAGKLVWKSLAQIEYERCHPEDSFEDLKRRARFSKEDKGLLREWFEVAEGLDRALVARPLKPLSSEGLPQDYVDINGAERWVLTPKNFAWQSLTREASHG